ncbi:MAG: hypothetical protein OXE50_14145 [Chloroflexi bacterium]|nr:hypothetical protein [Chloroflexota bacterium]
MLRFATYRERPDRALAAALALAAAAYVVWKITESPDQAVQFAYNGLSVGAVYALLALGFTLVYGTVWFFDLYYGAAAAMGAYGVFYLRTSEAVGGSHVNNPYVSALFALVVAGVIAWVLYEALFRRLQPRFRPRSLRVGGGLLAAAVGVYTGFVLTNPDHLHLLLSPAAGVVAAVAMAWLTYGLLRQLFAGVPSAPLLVVAIAAGAAVGAYGGFLLASAPGSRLYLSWAVSCLVSGCVGVALYRGLYVSMRKRARSPLIMLVASLGVLLAITAATAIVFQSAPRPLPSAFGREARGGGGGGGKGG